MDAYVIRQVVPTPQDASALLSVEARSLAESPYQPAKIAEILGWPGQYAYLAEYGRSPVGFCSCLQVPFQGSPRLEIDLLGVVPEHRGRGVGTRLIEYSVSEGRRRGVRRFRAVVAQGNEASLRAFRRAGFFASPRPRAMLVYELQGYHAVDFLPPGWRWQIVPSEAQRVRLTEDDLAVRGPWEEVHRLWDAQGELVGQGRCLYVQTLSYRGVWIEDLWAKGAEALRGLGRAVVERAKTLLLDEVGTLWAGREPLPLLREGYRLVGQYFILTRSDER